MQINGESHPGGGGQLTAPEDGAIYCLKVDGHAARVSRFPSRSLGTREIKPRCWLPGI